MVRVSLADELTVEPVEDGGVSEFDVDWTGDAPQPGAIDWPPEKDLIYHAHQLVEQYAERRLPVAATLRKRIPAGAGLGGGSSNAAAMLRALSDTFDLGLSHDDLREIAGHLGSDVAFFLPPTSAPPTQEIENRKSKIENSPSAIVSGLGERIEPTPLPHPLHFALILPGIHCATGRVYRAFDEMDGTKELDEAAVRALAATGVAHEAPLFNDLAAPACRLEPRLADLRDHCEQLAHRAVHVTGSGAAMFAAAEDAAEAQRLAEAISVGAEVPTVAVRTLE